MTNFAIPLRLPLGGRPKRRSRFGWGLFARLRIERFGDLPRDRRGIAQDVRIPESEDAIAFHVEPRFAHRVMSRLRAVGVMAAVEFDDEPRFETDEVRVIGTERMLSPEVPAVVAFQPQMPPQRTLGRRCIFPKRTRAFISHNHPHPKFPRGISASTQGGGGRKKSTWPS